MADESRMIEDGEALGYSKEELRKYVTDRLEREERKRAEDAEREERILSREDRKWERELEVQKLKEENEKMRLDLELQRINSGGGGRPVNPSGKSTIKLSQYKDGEDISIYLKNFERVKGVNGWDDEVALSALYNGFIGSRVSPYLNSLQPDSNYDEIKKLLIAGFGASIYDIQMKFRFAKLTTETVAQFIVVLKDHLTKMCDISNVNKEYEKLFEWILKDQLLRSVDRNLGSFLKEQNIFKMPLDEVIKIADNFQAIHGRASKTDKSATTCYTCGSSSHLARQCKMKNSKTETKDSDSSGRSNCFNCQSPEHYVKNCPFKNSKNEKIVQISLIESKPTQNFRKLPIERGSCNGRRVSVLRDTGATAILINSKYVKPSFHTGEISKVRFADGRSIEAPQAKINLKCPYFTGVTNAICVDNLPYDVLVGNVEGASCACVKSSTFDEPEDETDIACTVQTRGQIRNERRKIQSNVGIGSIKFDVANFNTEELIRCQQNDSSLKNLFDKTHDVSNTFPKFVFKNGVLVRIGNTKKNLTDKITQVVLPKEFRNKIISLAHDTLLSGHLGTMKTTKRISSHFFWPGMSGDISRYCRSCSLCQKNLVNKPVKAPLIPLPVLSTPFSRVAIDLIGPLPKSKSGNRFALVAVDLATKYPDAVPLKYIDSYTVSEALLNIFSRVGLPSELLHDQGAQFMSAVMKRFNQLLQIKSINTTPYHPQCNGSCENFNKSLKQMIKKVCNEEPEMWDKFLQPLLFAYREVPHTSTGFSPFELIFGYHVRGPLFLLKEKLLDGSRDPDQIPMTSHVLDIRNKIKDFMKISNENEKCAKTKQKVYFDKKTRKRSFKMGDKVLLLLPTSSNKLLAEWKGPFEVIRKLNDVDYLVRIQDKERVYHVNMLKQFHERSPDQIVSNLAESSELDLENTFEISDSLNESQKTKLDEHLGELEYIFSKTPGKMKNISYDIIVDENVKPIASLPYKVPYALKDKVKTELDQWLEWGIIKKSNSSWASPMVVVKNSDSTIRLAIDFRKLNNHVNVDNFPMPDRDTVISKLSNAKYLTKLDLTKAFLQIPLSQNSTKYTSFVTEYGQFEFCVVPFGIKFASGLCNRIISELLADCQGFITSFVDDLMIFSNSFEEHLEHIKTILRKLSGFGITLNRKKCKFAFSKVKFLGVVVGDGCVQPDQDKVKAIREFPFPIDKKQLRSFLGLLSYYRMFVRNLSTHIAPLTDLLKKDKSNKISWTENLKTIFVKAKNLVCNDTILTIPKMGHNFVLQTDASQVGLGAILYQDVEGTLRPISYISRKLNSAEVNYSVIEQECLAIKWAIEMFYQYLYGGRFTVRTDHAPLKWLKQNKEKNSRLMRWALSLQAYDFTVEYVKGSENFLADMLSRSPLEK